MRCAGGATDSRVGGVGVGGEVRWGGCLCCGRGWFGRGALEEIVPSCAWLPKKKPIRLVYMLFERDNFSANCLDGQVARAQ